MNDESQAKQRIIIAAWPEYAGTKPASAKITQFGVLLRVAGLDAPAAVDEPYVMEFDETTMAFVEEAA